MRANCVAAACCLCLLLAAVQARSLDAAVSTHGVSLDPLSVLRTQQLPLQHAAPGAATSGDAGGSCSNASAASAAAPQPSGDLEDLQWEEEDPLLDPLGLRPLLHTVPAQPQPHHQQRRHRRRLQQTLNAARFSLVGSRAAPSRPASTTYTTINVDSAGSPIPQSFLGISHEWDNIEELATTSEYVTLLKDLASYGTGPLILRVGGGSTDKQTAVSSPSVWNALKKMNSDTGMKFILGLNFLSGDVGLAKAQMAKAREQLPANSILSFEVGNEPNYYPNKKGRSTAEYLNCCFVNDWTDFAKGVACIYNKGSCWYNQLAGPVWGHIQIKPATLNWFLSRNQIFVNLVTVHWYKDTAETYNTPQTLLDEGPLRTDMAFLRQSVAISAKYNKQVRVAEMNSISNSGRRGVSNSFAAALWSLDGTLEAAAAGATGVNFHWGQGATVYTAIIRRKAPDGTILAPLVMTPFYAYLMFQIAVGSGSSFLQQDLKVSQGGRVKVWPLREGASGTVRVVIVNKHASAGTRVVVQLTKKNYGEGKLIRMLSRNGLWTTMGTDVTIGNVTYQVGGTPLGVPTGERVMRQWPPNGRLQYTVYVPAASAALLVLPRA